MKSVRIEEWIGRELVTPDVVGGESLVIANNLSHLTVLLGWTVLIQFPSFHKDDERFRTIFKKILH